MPLFLVMNANLKQDGHTSHLRYQVHSKKMSLSRRRFMYRTESTRHLNHIHVRSIILEVDVIQSLPLSLKHRESYLEPSDDPTHFMKYL